MNAWANPFADKLSNVSGDEVSDGEDSCADQVVYQEDYLKNLLGLYNRPDKIEQQAPLQVERLESDVELQTDNVLPVLPATRQEEVIWNALEASDLYVREKAQFSGFAFDSDVEDHPFEQDVDVSEAAPSTSQAKHLDCDKGETGQLQTRLSRPTDTWDHIILEPNDVDIDNHYVDIPATRTRNYKSQKGFSKKKFSFNFKAARLSRAHPELQQATDERQKVSLAEQLQKLAESDAATLNLQNTVYPRNASTKMSLGQQLLELAQQNSSGVSKRKQTKTASAYKRNVVKLQYGMIPEEESLDKQQDVDTTHGRDHMLSKEGPIHAEARSASINDQLQIALLAAGDERNQEIDRSDKIKGSIAGFAARLQKILEREKDDRNHFLKMLQMNRELEDNTSCLEVQILTKSLEARLAACLCQVVKLPKEWLVRKDSMEDTANSRVTVIFNMQTNACLELEAGNMVRIHPPWQEVSSGKGLSTILCTYFCQLI